MSKWTIHSEITIHEKNQPGRDGEERAGNRDFVLFLVPNCSGEGENIKIMCRNGQSILRSKFMRKTSPKGAVVSEQGTGI